MPSLTLRQFTRILVYRHGVWNANSLHSWHTQSPPSLGYLRIDCGEALVFQLPERWRGSATRTSIDIPMSTCLYAVLSGKESSMLTHYDQRYHHRVVGERFGETSFSVVGENRYHCVNIFQTWSQQTRCSYRSPLSSTSILIPIICY